MKVKVLGCSGGIGGKHLRTTSFRVDNDILIDAGTGVGDLSLTELSMIDHIFLTHSHLDHIVTIPFIVDTVGAMRDKPLTVYGIEETLDTLKKHIFNWSVWPDFTAIPTAETPFMRYQAIKEGQTLALDGRMLTVLPAKAERIASAFQSLPEVKHVPVHVVAQPELLPLIHSSHGTEHPTAVRSSRSTRKHMTKT